LCPRGRKVEVLEEEGHELGEAVLEELGEVLRVEVVVELEEEEQGTEEKVELVGGEGGARRQDRVGLLGRGKHRGQLAVDCEVARDAPGRA